MMLVLKKKCLLVWQKLWQLLCKLFRCRWGGPWLLLCCALLSLATLLPDPFCCCFHLNSKEFFLWFVYFSLQSFCFFFLFCFLQFTTSAFHLLSAFAGVIEQCCLKLSVLWAVVIWEKGLVRGLIIWQPFVGFAGEWSWMCTSWCDLSPVQAGNPNL